MQFVHVFLLVGLHIICIETRTAWVFSLKSDISKNPNYSAPTRPELHLNVSTTDVRTFVKVLTILRQDIERELSNQVDTKDLKRTLMDCTDLERENEEKVGTILPIPNPLEDLTLLSLLYDDSANWSKCTRSCKSQRLRKCRVRGLCSLDYLVEEAFCFFPGSKCVRKVKKLIKKLSKRHQENTVETKFKPSYSDEYNEHNDNTHHQQLDEGENYDDGHPHTHDDYQDGEQCDDDIPHNHEYDYEHNHDEDYEYSHDESYDHNHEEYDHDHQDYLPGDDEDYPTYDDENYYTDESETDDYQSNTFWEDGDYSYGDPDASYDCSDCDDENKDEYSNGEENKGYAETDNADKTCGISYAGIPRRSFRIIGGHRAVKGAWPWQVAIVDQYGVNFCGGTIIGHRWILTAAHCVKKRIRVRIAEHDVSRYDGEVEIKVRRSYLHPHFDSETYDRDIALLKLSKNVFHIGKSHVKKACLPQKSIKLPKKRSCVVLGWGSEKESHIYGSDYLMYAKVPIVSDRKCYDAYSDFYMTKHMFCAGFLRGGPDTCSGDSGGPLLCQDEDKRWVLHGITSFGDGCGQRGRFGVYAKVKNFLYWINRTISEH